MSPIAFQSLLPFEQAIVDARIASETARLNAKLAARAKREAEKRQAEIDKSHRRMIRDHERRQKVADRFAVCGISFYSTSPHDRRRSYWTHCHRCGKALTYYPTYAEAQANNGECVRR